MSVRRSISRNFRNVHSVTHRQSSVFILSELACTGKVGTKRFIARKVFFHGSKEVAKTLVLRRQTSVSFNTNQESSLEVDQGVKVHEESTDLI